MVCRGGKGTEWIDSESVVPTLYPQPSTLSLLNVSPGLWRAANRALVGAWCLLNVAIWVDVATVNACMEGQSTVRSAAARLAAE